MRDPLSVRLGPRISLFFCLQNEWAWEFPDYKKCSANNLSIDLLVSIFVYFIYGTNKHPTRVHCTADKRILTVYFNKGWKQMI